MNHLGKQTMVYKNRPKIVSAAAIAGKKEGDGPLGACFDKIETDDLLGKNTWEEAESALLLETVEMCLDKGGLAKSSLQAMLSGDLLNQIYASGFAMRSLGAPFYGLYGACSTMIEAATLGAALVDGGYVVNAACAASSHFCSAERQFRFPLELGNQRPPSAQWTATAAGCVLLSSEASKPLARVTHGTTGRVVDYRITDSNHMGAAMAPAVCDTLLTHLRDTGRTPDDYDLIITGDLGHIGRDILLALCDERGVKIPPEKLADCGASLYAKEQDTHAGGSGCGCIASVLCGHFLPMLQKGDAQRLLALGSGAMLSPTSAQQGESIPGISYAIALEGGNAGA